MATTLRSTTPPPPSQQARTPQTPRWGAKGDDYQPYSPRKSARLSQLSHGTTPPPHQSSRNTIHSSTPSKSTSSLTSTPSSPQTAKKRAPRQSLPEMGGRRVSGALTKDSAIEAASALGLPAPRDNDKMIAQQSTTVFRNNGMLPTPAKTPKKRPEKISPAVTSVARNLFAIRPSSDEIMPSPRKGRKHYTGFTLDSFEAEEEQTPIQIYTDSNDRVPEVDNNADNPFYGQGASVPSEPTKRSSKRRKIMVAGEGEQDIEDLEKREDGLVYVFRGKKMFRKFAVDSDTEDGTVSPELPRSMRSAVKPKLLFTEERAQAAEAKSHNTEDEEADTDIEDRDEITTPTAQAHDITATPKAPKFAPYTPPTTVRATRSKKVYMTSSPAGPGSDDEMANDVVPTTPMFRASQLGRAGLFDEWSHAGSTSRESKKRGTEAMGSPSRSAKKPRA
ncbi:uncharacterized protein LY89DRAFT_715880 [Mollisia scopiformis]|uniref:Uncharacterized protein n=1 Tax=Mollisia scopiformis TaxID=149040 RepID=A0A194XK55_MOLSC|nr:uncharacterized protein LY89DRAFT_715880 [Mollisia scopiformis]KUJ20494.1 hypothetical protein LY89DRAFT_715880 [Mollisia scopiformis]